MGGISFANISPLFLLIRFSSYLRVFFSTVYLTFLYHCLSFTLTFTQKYKPAFHSHPSATNAFIVWHSCHTVGLHIFSPSISLIVALLSSSFWQQYVYLLRFSSYPQYFETVSFHFFFYPFWWLSIIFSALVCAAYISEKGLFSFLFHDHPFIGQPKEKNHVHIRPSSGHPATMLIRSWFTTIKQNVLLVEIFAKH